MTDAISATRRQARELVDGSLEVKIIIDPRFKADFHAMFPEIDMPVAIAPLRADFEEIEKESTPAPAAKLKGGPRSKEAGKMCENPDFRAFIMQRYPILYGNCNMQDLREPVACVVRQLTGVLSRAELDHHESAWRRFQDLMREYNQWTNAALDRKEE